MTNDFLSVIDELEEAPVMTEALYELENIRGEYGNDVYIRVMDEVHDEDYDAAREILQDLE